MDNYQNLPKSTDSLDDLCAWKKCYNTGNSTTFINVNKNSKLYACVVCDGYDKKCTNHPKYREEKNK